MKLQLLNTTTFFRSDNDGDVLIIECATYAPAPGCQVYGSRVTDETQLSYAYGYEYFDQALEIHRKLLSLINSFRADVPAIIRN
jgi:hypothetical protein